MWPCVARDWIRSQIDVNRKSQQRIVTILGHACATHLLKPTTLYLEGTRLAIRKERFHHRKKHRHHRPVVPLSYITVCLLIHLKSPKTKAFASRKAYLLKDDTPIPLHEIEGADPDRHLVVWLQAVLAITRFRKVRVPWPRHEFGLGKGHDDQNRSTSCRLCNSSDHPAEFLAIGMLRNS